MATPKYRPSLSAAQISRLVSLLTDSSEDRALRRVLVPFLSKISEGAVNPAFIAVAREHHHNLSTHLGFSASQDPDTEWESVCEHWQSLSSGQKIRAYENALQAGHVTTPAQDAEYLSLISGN